MVTGRQCICCTNCILVAYTAELAKKREFGGAGREPCPTERLQERTAVTWEERAAQHGPRSNSYSAHPGRPGWSKDQSPAPGPFLSATNNRTYDCAVRRRFIPQTPCQPCDVHMSWSQYFLAPNNSSTTKNQCYKVWRSRIALAVFKYFATVVLSQVAAVSSLI